MARDVSASHRHTHLPATCGPQIARHRQASQSARGAGARRAETWDMGVGGEGGEALAVGKGVLLPPSGLIFSLSDDLRPR
eukprot:3938035-Rhodomonas_salina.2